MGLKLGFATQSRHVDPASLVESNTGEKWLVGAVGASVTVIALIGMAILGKSCGFSDGALFGSLGATLIGGVGLTALLVVRAGSSSDVEEARLASDESKEEFVDWFNRWESLSADKLAANVNNMLLGLAKHEGENPAVLKRRVKELRALVDKLDDPKRDKLDRTLQLFEAIVAAQEL